MGMIGDGIEILQLVNKAQNAELYKQIGEWIDRVGELQKQNEELTGERNDLREKLRFKGTLERVSGHTFVLGDDEEICPRCAEADLKIVHLLSMYSQKPPYQKATCPACKIVMLHNVPKKRAKNGELNLSPSVL